MSESTHTVVLVHGAFADGSGWNGVIERLQAEGVHVIAPANPLRGIAADSAYLAAVFAQIEGAVLAVGHSYGGAVITNAATDAPNVVGLVYVAAFAPDAARPWVRSRRARRTASSTARSCPGSTRPPAADRRRSSTSTQRRPATRLRATFLTSRPH